MTYVHETPPTVAFWTANKPCEQALTDLTEAYNKLADQVEEAWATIAKIERELRTVDALREGYYVDAQHQRERAGALEAELARLLRNPALIAEAYAALSEEPT